MRGRVSLSSSSIEVKLRRICKNIVVLGRASVSSFAYVDRAQHRFYFKSELLRGLTVIVLSRSG